LVPVTVSGAKETVHVQPTVCEPDGVPWVWLRLSGRAESGEPSVLVRTWRERLARHVHTGVGGGAGGAQGSHLARRQAPALAEWLQGAPRFGGGAIDE